MEQDWKEEVDGAKAPLSIPALTVGGKSSPNETGKDATTEERPLTPRLGSCVEPRSSKLSAVVTPTQLFPDVRSVGVERPPVVKAA